MERILPARDRLAVTGDLREEYVEAVLPRVGRLRAHLWYLRQALSLSPFGVSQHRGIHTVLLLVSLFTLGCGCWLVLMEGLLRHPGYVTRAGADLAIAFVPLATILVLCLNLGIRVERWLWAGAIALIGVAVRALLNNGRSGHFEGFVLIIAVALALQGILMLVALGRPRPPAIPGSSEGLP